ncbi:MAG: hypothetical protein ACE5Z5_07805 [Candidatus Bathyarchaeia archaeon]
MSRDRNRRTLGIALIAVGFLGLVVYSILSTAWSYSTWPSTMGPMMGRGMMPMSMMGGWNYGELEEVDGTVEKIEWMEIELEVDGEEVEVHGPPWFWQTIGIKEGDSVSAKGVFVSMMEPGEGWHKGLIPLELKINGKTYGNASSGIPVWMQG